MTRPWAAIFVHEPECSKDCAWGLALALEQDFDIRFVSEADLNLDTLHDVDLLCFPGGMGDADG